LLTGVSLHCPHSIWALTLAGEYWVVNQILSKGLHNGDAETLQYTTTLMDKLEQVRMAMG